MQADRQRIADALPAYDIGEVLGQGGWGVVVAGHHRHLDRSVAIKQLPTAAAADVAVRRRFTAEARVLASLDHPHVVPVYDFVEREDLCLLVMEQLPGGTLRERATTTGFTATGAVAVCLACAAGLNAAHVRGVLHRDVKPENMLFAASGAVKVTDFGIAKVLGGADTMLTRAGDVVGTPSYIAPEQVRGEELSPATDVYALATMLYELLSGELPFTADGDVMSLLFKHAYAAPVPLLDVTPDVPAEVAAVVMRGLATEPAERYATAEAFGVALAEAGTRAWGANWLSADGMPVVLGAERIVAPTRGATPPSPLRTGPAAALPPAAGPTARSAVTAGPGPVREQTPAPAVPEPALPEPAAEEPDEDEPPRRRPVVVAVVVVLVLLLAVLAVWLLPRLFTVYGSPAGTPAGGPGTDPPAVTAT
ncbi:serine/threonine protein kinase [Geodermatophilus tzadiensis]|uniref:non-specific serine/threonine protein kinase n=1 Tax=Geodermatophilus tzadiensis TaxID=1137988 RepID=A0A2T0TWT9_9ACTN|nr:serine/threonine-protein kinase [Geodermatophilus tzadiensis]PRY50123.1 serine/threonine protein kinase [Geodermatophilus tzadiensis]